MKPKWVGPVSFSCVASFSPSSPGGRVWDKIIMFGDTGMTQPSHECDSPCWWCHILLDMVICKQKMGDRQETVLREGQRVSCFRASRGIEMLASHSCTFTQTSVVSCQTVLQHFNHPQLPTRMFDLVVHEGLRDLTDHSHASQVQHLNFLFRHTPPT